METQTEPENPPIDIQNEAWRHLVHTLFHLLPPPLTDTPEGRRTRNRAAIARIAALDPVTPNEAELAAQCVVARAQAEEIARLTRVHASDIALAVKLNSQYAAMVRISLAAQNRLLGDQQRRRRREQNPHDADTDEWTRHVAANTMLQAMPPEPEPEPEPESHTAENETPMRQLPLQPGTLRPPPPPPPPRAPDSGWLDEHSTGNGINSDPGHLPHRPEPENWPPNAVPPPRWRAAIAV